MTSLPWNVELRRMLVFVAVGALNTAVCYALFAALVHLAQCHHHTALVGDYALGIAVGYLLQRFATFADRKHVERTLPKYVAAYVAAFALNLAVLDVLVRWLVFGPLAAQAVGLVVVTLTSYTVQQRWVFRSEEVDRPAARAPVMTGAPRRASEFEYTI